jgi:hypothetical protein
MQLQQIQEGTNVLADTAVWTIGANDEFKISAICSLIEMMEYDFYEVLAIDLDSENSKLYAQHNIPVVQDLLGMASVLRQLIDELQSRQKEFNFYGTVRHPIVCIVELDRLQEALEYKAIELGHKYDKREIEGALSMLCEGSNVGIHTIVSSQEANESYALMYVGAEASKFISSNTKIDSDIFKEISHQSCPCFLLRDDTIYPVFGLSYKVSLPERNQINPDDRFIDLSE